MADASPLERRWVRHPRAPLLVPAAPEVLWEGAGDAWTCTLQQRPRVRVHVSTEVSSGGGAGDAWTPVLVFCGVREALAKMPYASLPQAGAAFGPLRPAEALAADARQQRRHAEASAGGPGLVEGYATWVTRPVIRGGSCLGSQQPLMVRETTQHTGTRVWEGAWLHLAWARSHIGELRGRAIMELGAGCGLLGLSLQADAQAASVTVSDFGGHSPAGAALMDNLVRNCGHSCRVLELDWARPDHPREMPEGTECQPSPVDVILATEVLYTEEGAQLLVGLLPTWLKADGKAAAYFLSNRHRAGVESFRAGCEAVGLLVEMAEVPAPQDIPARPTMFATTADDYVHYKVTLPHTL